MCSPSAISYWKQNSFWKRLTFILLRQTLLTNRAYIFKPDHFLEMWLESKSTKCLFLIETLLFRREIICIAIILLTGRQLGPSKGLEAIFLLLSCSFINDLLDINLFFPPCRYQNLSFWEGNCKAVLHEQSTLWWSNKVSMGSLQPVKGLQEIAVIITHEWFSWWLWGRLLKVRPVLHLCEWSILARRLRFWNLQWSYTNHIFATS